MPCDKLAVQTGKVVVNDKVLAAMFASEQAHAALVALIQQQTGVTMSAYTYSNSNTLNLYGGGVDVTVRLDGSVVVRARSNAETQRFTVAVQTAIAQVAVVLAQNMIAQQLALAGVPVVKDEYTAAGNRVMTLRL